VVVALLVAASCGGGEERRDAADAGSCSLDARQGRDPAHLSVDWRSGWDLEGNEARVEAFDADEPDIAVDVHDLPGFFPPALALIGDTPPVLSEVSYSMVPALALAGAIEPIGPCLEAAGVSTSGVFPAAVANGTVDGLVYGVPRAIDSTLLLYDRAAFRRAGLDPDRPPRTLDDVRRDAEALRDRAGIAQPVAWNEPQLTLIGLDIDSDDARDAARAWVDLGRAGLLLPPQDGPPPVGSGAAAMQWVDPHGLWSYASALREGQAPQADLGVAPLPGVHGPVSGIGGSVWVVSSRATAEQVAAAVRFLAWYGRPEQQSAFHIGTDLYPVSLTIDEVPSVQAYWREHPLVRQGWEALVAEQTELDGWERVLGAFATIIPWMHEVADGSADFDAQWARIVRTLDALEMRQRSQPESLLRCLAEHIEDPVTPAELCASTG
jgi:ABC-type glycerol-3-phosphate transport system substrate-binding protein